MIGLVAFAGDGLFEPGNGVVELALSDEVSADVVVGVAERGINQDGVLALYDGLVDASLKTVGPAEKRVGFGGGIKLDGLLVEVDGKFEVALHLEDVGLLKQVHR
jgi:hypothetical protein